MPSDFVDFNPVSRITINTVGQPGQRVFLMQASQGASDITLKMEKEQVRVLAASILELLEELEKTDPRPHSKLDAPLSSDLMLQEPLDPVFAVGQIGLGYERTEDMIVMVIQEVQIEEKEDLAAVRFWATRPQMKALSTHALEIVGQGRPICPLCNDPIDPAGHFCPKQNGHDKVEWN